MDVPQPQAQEPMTFLGNLPKTWANVNALKKYQTDLVLEPSLQVGDIICWKENMCNRRTDGIFIITEVFATPAIDDEPDEGTPRYMEPLHGKYALLVQNPQKNYMDFFEYTCDFRRMRRVQDSELI
jgi:hypothetical protein